jgi:hypothetical protein
MDSLERDLRRASKITNHLLRMIAISPHLYLNSIRSQAAGLTYSSFYPYVVSSYLNRSKDRILALIHLTVH